MSMEFVSSLVFSAMLLAIGVAIRNRPYFSRSMSEGSERAGGGRVSAGCSALVDGSASWVELIKGSGACGAPVRGPSAVVCLGAGERERNRFFMPSNNELLGILTARHAPGNYLQAAGRGSDKSNSASSLRYSTGAVRVLFSTAKPSVSARNQQTNSQNWALPRY